MGEQSANYQGGKLLAMVMALCMPALVLYLSFVFALSGGQASAGSSARLWMSRLSTVALIVFVFAQLGAAVFLQRSLRARTTTAGKALQYGVALLVGLAFSFIAAGVLEALGFNVLARMRKLG